MSLIKTINRSIFGLLLLTLTASQLQAQSNCIEQHEEVIVKVIGRMLTESEVKDFCSANSEGIEEEVKTRLIEMLLKTNDFVENISAIFRIELLQGTGENKIFHQLLDFDQIKLQPGNEDYGNYEFDRLTSIYYGKDQYLEGELSIRELQIRFLNNFIFDQINMGVDNFVNAAFLYLLGRHPTLYEKEQSKLMCENSDGKLFFQKGSSKEDFLDILTSNENYFEFQIKYWHERFLLKLPESNVVIELMNAVNRYNEFDDPVIDIIEHLLNHQL